MNPRVIIIEGAQGVGKGTVSTLLREQMPYTNLLRLSGLSGNDSNARFNTYKTHNEILNLISKTSFTGINYILDRSFLSEDVYCELGFKNYSFREYTDRLSRRLNDLALIYDVQFIVLTAREKDFKVRLLRDKPQYAGVDFKVSNSLAQQEMYIKRLKYLKGNCPNVDFGIVEIGR